MCVCACVHAHMYVCVNVHAYRCVHIHVYINFKKFTIPQIVHSAQPSQTKLRSPFFLDTTGTDAILARARGPCLGGPFFNVFVSCSLSYYQFTCYYLSKSSI